MKKRKDFLHEEKTKKKKDFPKKNYGETMKNAFSYNNGLLV